MTKPWGFLNSLVHHNRIFNHRKIDFKTDIRINMDGDQSAKTMDAGANASIHNTDLSSGIHESGNNAVSNPLPSLT